VIARRAWRIGLSDAHETWLFPRLMQASVQSTVDLQVRWVAVPITGPEALVMLDHGQLDCIMHAYGPDEPLAEGHVRVTLGPVQLWQIWDARVAPSAAPKGAAEVVVSYSGQVRGRVEDHAHDIACSVTSFAGLAALLVGAARVATVPDRVAQALCQQHPWLAHAPARDVAPQAVPQALGLTHRTSDAQSELLKLVLAAAQAQRR
jgi:hypothetical protein